MNDFRVVVVGLGIQGPKRIAAAGADFVASVDPVKPADYVRLQDVPLDSFDAALLCVPDDAKPSLISYLIEAGKHVLVEKPLFGGVDWLRSMEGLARRNGVFLYTAYNHRFEPHFIRVRDMIASGALGAVYRMRMFYGNGTARLVRDSEWRDQGAGVLPDLGSHLLDALHFWFGELREDFRVISARRFENRAPDHVVVLADRNPIQIELEMTLLSWRNHFTCEIFGEKGQIVVSSLCKWGPSSFTHYERILPAGRPPETVVTLVQPDPTWLAEYQFFRSACLQQARTDLSRDVWIAQQLERMSSQAIDLEVARES